jgi:hypothetical protein
MSPSFCFSSAHTFSSDLRRLLGQLLPILTHTALTYLRPITVTSQPLFCLESKDIDGDLPGKATMRNNSFNMAHGQQKGQRTRPCSNSLHSIHFQGKTIPIRAIKRALKIKCASPSSGYLFSMRTGGRWPASFSAFITAHFSSVLLFMRGHFHCLLLRNV